MDGIGPAFAGIDAVAGFARRADTTTTERSACRSAIQLKIYIYGDLNFIQPSRQLERGPA
jgi:hypothetical protein